MSDLAGIEYEQNYIVLAGVPSPGVCIVQGLTNPRKLQINDGYALSNATVVYLGDSLPKFSVTLQMTSALDLREWKRFAKLLATPPLGTRPNALKIEHPLIEECGIKSVLVEDRTQLTPSPTGLWTVKIDFVKWQKPAPALGRPNGAIPDADKKAPTPQDAQDIQIEQARARFAKAEEATL